MPPHWLGLPQPRHPSLSAYSLALPPPQPYTPTLQYHAVGFFFKHTCLFVFFRTRLALVSCPRFFFSVGGDQRLYCKA